LADNIAGYFSDKIKVGDRDVPTAPQRKNGASLFWETFDPEDLTFDRAAGHNGLQLSAQRNPFGYFA
jgi:hypothetical protein